MLIKVQHVFDSVLLNTTHTHRSYSLRYRLALLTEIRMPFGTSPDFF